MSDSQVVVGDLAPVASLEKRKGPGVSETEERGERTFHDTDAAYVLPNDTAEHQRLESKHRLFKRIMGNKIFHAPLDKATMQKALDVGCGTGAVTDEMASVFPGAQVYGVDLSPVPHVRQKLHNIEYIQGDMMDVNDARFDANSFDFIFSRLLVLGMSDWKGYVERCVALAKPGGWIEMHDVSHMVHHVLADVSSLEHLRPHDITMAEMESGSHRTDGYAEASSWLWNETFARLLALKGVDFYCGAHIPLLFAEAGLTDIRIRRYMLPITRWEEQTEDEAELAGHIGPFVRDVIPVALRKAGEKAGLEYAAEADEAARDVKRYYEASEGSKDFFWMYVVCGRKPKSADAS